MNQKDRKRLLKIRKSVKKLQDREDKLFYKASEITGESSYTFDFVFNGDTLEHLIERLKNA